MISKEGFTVNDASLTFTECSSTSNGSCTADSTTNTVTVTASDGPTFTFKNNVDYSLNGRDDSPWIWS